jgi:hypothetical protein
MGFQHVTEIGDATRGVLDLCLLCEFLANFAVKSFLTAEDAKESQSTQRRTRKRRHMIARHESAVEPRRNKLSPFRDGTRTSRAAASE